MLPGFINHLINPDFSHTDFGTAGRTTTGYVVPRWKLTRSSATVDVTATPTALPGDITQPKWLRGKAGMRLNILALPVGETITLTQQIEGADRFSRQVARSTIVIYGPAGAIVQYGVGDTYRTVTTLGETTPVTASYTEMIEDPPSESIAFTIKPLSAGDFNLAFVQVDWPDDLSAPASLELRPRQVERILLNRYVYRLAVGSSAALGATSQNLALAFPATMRRVPTIETSAATVRLKEVATGTVLDVPTPTYSLHDATEDGCRLRIAGTPASVIPATSIGYITTPNAVVLTADY